MTAALLLLLAASPLAQTSACDDFNRASGTNMGFEWNEVKGDLGILGNVGYGLMAGSQYMLHTVAMAGAFGSTMSVDFLPDVNGRAGQHVALIAGHADNVNVVYVKVQDNDLDGLYDRVSFATGIDGAAWSAPGFFDLATPTASGRMTVYFTNGGDTANCDVRNGASGALERFESSGLLSTGVVLGLEFGIGVLNSASFDDYELNGGCFSGPTLSVTNLVAGMAATVTVDNATPGGTVGVGWSIAGSGPSTVPAGPCGMVTVDLSQPIRLLPLLTADPAGTASIAVPVPPAGAGLTVYFHAVDIGGCSLTNSLALTVQ